MALLQKMRAEMERLNKQAMAGVAAQEHMARRAWLQVIYSNKGADGKDISETLAEYLLSVSYTDNLSGQVDDISLTLEDKAGLWQGDWMPTKGATLDVTLHTYNWYSLYEGEITVSLGMFDVDEIELSSAPDVVTIKAVAITVGDDSTLRSTLHSRTWENISVQKLANDIAQENEMDLSWYCDDNPIIDKVEQDEESDLDMLQKVCNDAGFALKVTTNEIIIFDEAAYEEEDPLIEIYHPDTQKVIDISDEDDEAKPERILQNTGYSFKSKLRDVYWACHVKYAKDKDKAVIEGTFVDPNKESGAVLEVNQEVNSQAEAERLAKKKLREKNREEYTGSFNTIGQPFLCAGETVEMIGFGTFSGKYIITQAKHDLSSSGFVTSIEIRRCLIGY